MCKSKWGHGSSFTFLIALDRQHEDVEIDYSRKRNPNLNNYPKLKLKGKKAKLKNIIHLDSIAEKSKEEDDARSELTLEAEKLAYIP